MTVTPWGTPVDPTGQIEEAEVASQSPAYQPVHYEHFADYISDNKWDRATWLFQPDPLMIEVLMDTTVGVAMCGLGMVALLGMIGPIAAAMWLVILTAVVIGSIYRHWNYSRRVWPVLYGLAHSHALPSIANETVAKRWVPGHRRQASYLQGKLPKE